MQLFSADANMFFLKILKNISPENMKKPPSKFAHNWLIMTLISTIFLKTLRSFSCWLWKNYFTRVQFNFFFVLVKNPLYRAGKQHSQ